MSGARVNPICLTPDPGHYTFGYYDRQPWSPDMRWHLALRIPQQDHLPAPGETAEVGVIDMQTDTYGFTALTDTRAWNHQQGSMTIWLPHEPGCFVFNDAVQENDGWRLTARVWDIEKGQQRELPLPVYAVSPDGHTAATLDFGRILTRRGYSYMVADSSKAPPLPDDAGVWTMNLETGANELIVTIRELAETHPNAYELKDSYVWLNHIIWNCDGSRLMVLFRYRPGNDGPWRTFLYTMRPDGTDIRCALPDAFWKGISHQIWGRTPGEILVDAAWRGRGAEFIVFNDDELKFDVLADGITGPNGHLAWSPDFNWIAADSYPQGEERLQKLRIVHHATGREIKLGEFYHAPVDISDIRCDLHPRFSPDGTRLSIDSIMTGERKIYIFNLEDVIKNA